MPNTSIIALCWNHCEDLTKPFVTQILDSDGKFELILVNNGSTDGTKEFLNKIDDKRVKVIHAKKNLGFGGGNNLGYAKASGKYICFINNDVLFSDPGWLNKLIKYADWSLVGQNLYKDNSATTYKNKITPYIGGWCMLGKRDLFEKIKEDGELFDPGFGLAYFEDVDISVRAVNAGFGLESVDVGLVHLGSKSSIDQLNMNESFKKSQAHFISKMTQYDLQRRGGKRIVFFASGVRYPFTDSDYEGRGVGGAEASLILLARELAKLGHAVEIYNNTDTSCTQNGVEYHNISEFRPYVYCDVFVLFRSFHPVLRKVSAVHKVFWSCDQWTDSYGVWDKLVFPFVDKVVAISDYHNKFLTEHHHLSDGFVETLELGINYPDYKSVTPKVPGRAIYCSVPMRGLAHLARLAPQIKEQVKNFELIVTSDYRLWGLDDPDNQQFRDMLGKYDFVKFLGKIPRSELVEYQKTSQVMAYPCTYEECFCISAMECIAAGAVPVTSTLGAMDTTVGDCGVKLSSVPGQGDYDKSFVDSVVQLLSNEGERMIYQNKGQARAKKYAWSERVKSWIDLFDRMDGRLKHTPMIKCNYCDKEVSNSYLLNKHVSAKHGVEKLANEKDPEASFELKLPDRVIITTRKYVEVGVNGRWYSGTELNVDGVFVDAVISQLREAYGDDIVI